MVQDRQWSRRDADLGIRRRDAETWLNYMITIRMLATPLAAPLAAVKVQE